MTRPEPELTALQYCQKHGLRILASHAFDFFYEELQHQPGNYLEIGCFEGFALRELAKVYPQKMFYGIDPFIEDGNTYGHQVAAKVGETMVEQRRIARANTEGGHNIRLIEQSSMDAAKASDDDLHSLNVTAV